MVSRRTSRFAFIYCLGLAILFSVSAAHAAMEFTGQRVGTNVVPVIGAQGNVGRIDPGMSNLVIDSAVSNSQQACRYLDLSSRSNGSLAVFYNTSQEWLSFLNNIPSNTTVDKCCPAGSIPADVNGVQFSACPTADNPQSVTGETIRRGRAGDAGSVKKNFQCSKQFCWSGDAYNPPGCTTVNWQETALRQADCMSGSDVNGSWIFGAQTVTGAMPAHCPPQVNGQTWWSVDGNGSRNATTEECQWGGTVTWQNLRQWQCDDGTTIDTQQRSTANETRTCNPPPKCPATAVNICGVNYALPETTVGDFYTVNLPLLSPYKNYVADCQNEAGYWRTQKVATGSSGGITVGPPDTICGRVWVMHWTPNAGVPTSSDYSWQCRADRNWLQIQGAACQTTPPVHFDWGLNCHYDGDPGSSAYWNDSNCQTYAPTSPWTFGHTYRDGRNGRLRQCINLREDTSNQVLGAHLRQYCPALYAQYFP
jgi:hypothetical protein